MRDVLAMLVKRAGLSTSARRSLGFDRLCLRNIMVADVGVAPRRRPEGTLRGLFYCSDINLPHFSICSPALGPLTLFQTVTRTLYFRISLS